MRIFKSLAILIGLLSLVTFSTHSVFTSRASVVGNEFSTGIWYIPAARIVINEVYYNPDTDHQVNEVDGKNEWIELYNTTDASINVKNWQIKTDNYTRTITANKTIPAYGFLMLSHDNSTWTFWTLPAGVGKADLGTAPNDYMRNSDTVKLYDTSAVLVDQLNYSEGQEGHSFERDPNGSSNIVDLAIPTPGS